MNNPGNSKRMKYLIGAVVIGAAFLYLIWTSFSASFEFALTPDEFFANQPGYGGKTVKISGAVPAGSIYMKGGDYFFRIAGADSRDINVHYKGIAPNTFREGAEVVVSGTFDAESNIFEAREMLTKCASKYEEK